MASDLSFVEFIADQMKEAGSITYRKMFGEYALYCDGKVIALICDDQLFVKPTDAGRAFIGDVVEAPAYPGAKPSFLIEDKFEDREWISDLARITFNGLPAPKPKKIFKKIKKGAPGLVLAVLIIIPITPVLSQENISLVEATPDVSAYAINVVKPVLDASADKDILSLLRNVCGVLLDPKTGINKNAVMPETYMVYDTLDKIKLGFLATFKLTPEQKKIVKSRHDAFMSENPADVFFAPSADEIITTKAAFGCSHYARSFMAVVKALDLIDNRKDMRYAISCKADDYNNALINNNQKTTINGHQFVLVKINNNWIAVNTSKNEWIEMPKTFSPDFLPDEMNIQVRFKSYPETTFLIRKIGKDYDDDCGDNSLTSLMNIYRSGNAHDRAFRWKAFTDL